MTRSSLFLLTGGLVPALALTVLVPAGLAGAQEVVQPLPGTTDADRLADTMRRLAANPRDMDALVRAGELSTGLGDLSGAAALYARAEKVDPRDGRVKAGMASILVRSERPGEALRYFAQAESAGLSPRAFAADRGLAYDLIGQQDRAQRDYRVALRDTPDDETIRRYALSLGISGRQELALQQLAPLIQKTDRGAWRARAFILAMTGDVPGATYIATTMMPAGMSQGLQPFFQRLPTLAAADRAFAVHFGEVHTSAERIADARMTPPLPALGPDASAPVMLAAAQPAPATQLAAAETRAPVRRERRSSSRRAQREDVAPAVRVAPQPPVQVAAATAPTVQPLPQAPVQVAVAPPVRPLPQAPAQAVAPAPVVQPSQAPVQVAAATAPPARPVAQVSAPVQVQAPVANTPPVVLAQTTVSPAPVVARVEPQRSVPTVIPAPVTLAGTVPAANNAAATAPMAAIPAASTPIASAPAPVVTASVTPAPIPTPPAVRTAPIETPRARVAAAREDSILARIVAGLSIPASELGVAPAVAPVAVRPPIAAVASISPDAQRVLAEAKAKTARDVAAKKALDEKLVAEPPVDRKAAARKAAADKKALAEKKAAAEKKAIADKEAAEAKRVARANPERIWVQVATGATEGDLPKAWKGAKAKAPAAFGSRGGWTTPWRATNRVLAGPFKTGAEARTFVNQLAKEGVSTFSFTSDAGQVITKLPPK